MFLLMPRCAPFSLCMHQRCRPPWHFDFRSGLLHARNSGMQSASAVSTATMSVHRFLSNLLFFVKTLVSRNQTNFYNECKADHGQLSILNLQKLLSFLTKEVPSFAQELERRCAASQLSMVFYADGITPGSALSHHNTRKCWVFYVTFAEFKELLGSEDFWFTVCAVPTSVVRSWEGGLSSICRELLHNLLIDQGLATRGIVLNGRRHSVRLSQVLADEEGLASIWHIKGAAPPLYSCRGVDRQTCTLHACEASACIAAVSTALQAVAATCIAT